jgi:hypothetical protein
MRLQRDYNGNEMPFLWQDFAISDVCLRSLSAVGIVDKKLSQAP